MKRATGRRNVIPPEHSAQPVGIAGYRVVGLDLDGVCADYVAGFRSYAADALGVAPSDLPDPAVYDFVKAGWPFRDADHYEQVHAEAVAEGLYAKLPAIRGVGEAVRALSDADVHVRILTHRLFVAGTHRRVVIDTVEWLEEHRIPFMSLCLSGLKDTIDASVYVDDAPPVISQLRHGTSRPTFVFTQPYNAGLPGPHIDSWDSGAVQTILDAIANPVPYMTESGPDDVREAHSSAT